MSSDTQYTQRLLVCSSDPNKIAHLEERVINAGFEVECVTDASIAKQRLWEEHFSGIAVDLLLANQDGISFAREVRREQPWLPVLILNTETIMDSETGDNINPDWLQNSSQQARLIFALKQACIHSIGQQISILHIEEDDAMAALIFNTLGGQINVFRARTIQEAQIALSLREFDFTLVNSQRPILDPMATRKLAPDALVIDNSLTPEPLLTLLHNMRRSSKEHSIAFC